MIPDDGSSRWWSCTRKQKYASESLAREVAEYSSRRPNTPPIDISRCSFCNCWHLIKRPKKTMPSRR